MTKRASHRHQVDDIARQLQITQPFNLRLNLTMGPAFRWREAEPGWFSGVLGESLLQIRETAGGIECRVGSHTGERDTTDADVAGLRRYFREDMDLPAVYADLSRALTLRNWCSSIRACACCDRNRGSAWWHTSARRTTTFPASPPWSK